jgi:hypothetical protein
MCSTLPVIGELQNKILPTNIGVATVSNTDDTRSWRRMDTQNPVLSDGMATLNLL